MNQSKAKKLRKQVYGQMSHRVRQYKWQIHNFIIYNKGGKPSQIKRYTLINVGLRRQYLDLKKAN